MECYMFDLLRIAALRNSIYLRDVYLDNLELLNQPGSIKFLLEQAATWNIEDEMTRILVEFITPENSGEFLSYAVSKGKLHLTEELLIKGARPEDVLEIWSDCPSRQIFDMSGNRKEILKLLIQYGLDVHSCISGKSLLLQFVRFFLDKSDKDAVDIAEILVNSGVPLDSPDDDNYSPVHWAVINDHARLVKFLVKLGADVNRRSTNSESFPLLSSVSCSNEEIMALLLTKGAEVNAQDENGCSALHFACEQRRERAIGILIRQGADISAMDLYGKTPFALLESRHHEDHSALIENCKVAMIKEFARVNFKSPESFQSMKDKNLVTGIPSNKKYFERCTAELELMKSKFYEPFTYHEVMDMSTQRLANLARNEKFLLGFGNYLLGIGLYSSDFEKILEEAVILRNRSMTVENRLHSVFGNVLPSVVIRILEKSLTPEDLPVQ